MEILHVAALTVAIFALLAGMASGLISFTFYICMFGEKRPMPPIRQLLLGGVWFHIDENLSQRGLLYRRQFWRWLLIAFGAATISALSMLAVHPEGIQQFFRPGASNSPP